MSRKRVAGGALVAKIVVVVLIALVVVLVAIVLAGRVRWQRETRALHARLDGARDVVPLGAYDPRELDGLPEPVQRYFRAVLQARQPLVTAASIEHSGTFNMGETTDRWTPFRSTQRVVLRRPGFVWDARIRMAPGMAAHVHDAYIAGQGVLRATLAGLFTVMQQANTPELAQGELMRFLAEAAWYPTALLPSQGVRWEALDDTRASATLTDARVSVRLQFHFDAEGRISSVRSEGRYRVVDGVQVPTPWQGRFWNYEMRGGMLVPLDGEVEWLLAEGPKPYWRGRIQRVEYEVNQVSAGPANRVSP